MIRKSISLVAGVLTAAAAAAQVGFGRQVEVTRDYVPDVSLATKLAVTPRMGDTTTLRPEVDYRMAPVAVGQWRGPVTKIGAARVDEAGWESRHPMWIRAGGGLPMATEADFYGTSTNSGSDFWGGYANHRGLYSNITNDYGQQVSGAVITNRARLFGRTALGRRGRLALAGSGGYRYDYYARYAYMADSKGTPKQAFSVPDLEFSLGNDFSDLSRINFSVGGSIYYLTDRFDVAERGVAAFARAGLGIGVGQALLDVRIDSRKARTGPWPNHTGTILRVNPRYELRAGDIGVRLGAGVLSDKTGGGDFRVYVMPDIRLDYNTGSSRLVPYVELGGGIADNGVMATAERVPYYDLATTDFNDIRNTRRLDARIGAGGKLGRHFAYNVYGGYTSFRDIYYVSYFESRTSRLNSVALSYDAPDDLDVVTFGVETGFSLAGRLDVQASAQAHRHIADGYDHPVGMPAVEACLAARWAVNDRLSVRLGAEFSGKRYFRTVIAIHQEPGFAGFQTRYDAVDPMVDLSLGADYRLKSGIALYVDGTNLTGSKLYPHPHYPQFGARVAAGVKIGF